MGWQEQRGESARRHGIARWAVDPNYSISHIHIIESLDVNDEPTGTRLFQLLEVICPGNPVTPVLHRSNGRNELFDLLARLRNDAEHGQFPMLHFETHGLGPSGATTSPGLSLASRDEVTWQDLAPVLTAINEATRLRLIVFMAACYGADIATLIHLLEAAPVRLIVGPTEELGFHVIERASNAFYAPLIEQADGNAAFRAINPAQYPGDPGFWKLPAEAMFLEIMRAYFNEGDTYDLINARAGHDLRARGLPAEAIPEALEQRKLEIHEELFDQCYERFFHVDRHPEIAERFILSFQRCFLGEPAV